VPEGTLRQFVKVDDSYWNCHLMSILRTEWTNGYGTNPPPEQSG
jgi:RimJ/RimL family protein N-acetyltransferase